METVEDIVREMRNEEDMPLDGYSQLEAYQIMQQLADRIEAAYNFEKLEMKADQKRAGNVIIERTNKVIVLTDENAKLCACLNDAVSEKCYCCKESEDDRRELCDQCIVADWKEAIKGASK